MKITLLKESKVAASEISTLCNEYTKRSLRYAQVDSAADQKLTNKKSGTYLVVLDERGKPVSSEGWAALLKKSMDNPAVKRVYFIVGGAHGLSEIEKQADLRINISPMVLAGDLAWLVLHEQVYRALSILNGSKYHHA